MLVAHGFEGELVEWEGPAAWHFVKVPKDAAPDFVGAFGRVPVIAEVDGVRWVEGIIPRLLQAAPIHPNATGMAGMGVVAQKTWVAVWFGHGSS